MISGAFLFLSSCYTSTLELARASTGILDHPVSTRDTACSIADLFCPLFLEG